MYNFLKEVVGQRRNVHYSTCTYIQSRVIRTRFQDFYFSLLGDMSDHRKRSAKPLGGKRGTVVHHRARPGRQQTAAEERIKDLQRALAVANQEVQTLRDLSENTKPVFVMKCPVPEGLASSFLSTNGVCAFLFFLLMCAIVTPFSRVRSGTQIRSNSRNSKLCTSCNLQI